MAKFDAIYRGDEDQKKIPSRLAATAASELILSKDQLYEMFQTILGVKKYEHIILFNACQVNIGCYFSILPSFSIRRNFNCMSSSGCASSEKSERNGGDFDVIFQSKGIPN